MQSDFFADIFTGRFGCWGNRSNSCEPFWSSQSVTTIQSFTFERGSQYMGSHKTDCFHSGM